MNKIIMSNEEAIGRLDALRRENPLMLMADVAALDLAISALSQLSRDHWVSVEERLPEESGFYLVYLRAPEDTGYEWLSAATMSYAAGMYFDKNQMLWEDSGNGSYNAVISAVNKKDAYVVTHWRPLPEPPKEET